MHVYKYTYMQISSIFERMYGKKIVLYKYGIIYILDNLKVTIKLFDATFNFVSETE